MDKNLTQDTSSSKSNNLNETPLMGTLRFQKMRYLENLVNPDWGKQPNKQKEVTW